MTSQTGARVVLPPPPPWPHTHQTFLDPWRSKRGDESRRLVDRWPEQTPTIKTSLNTKSRNILLQDICINIIHCVVIRIVSSDSCTFIQRHLFFSVQLDVNTTHTKTEWSPHLSYWGCVRSRTELQGLRTERRGVGGEGVRGSDSRSQRVELEYIKYI